MSAVPDVYVILLYEKELFDPFKLPQSVDSPVWRNESLKFKLSLLSTDLCSWLFKVTITFFIVIVIVIIYMVISFFFWFSLVARVTFLLNDNELISISQSLSAVW